MEHQARAFLTLAAPRQRCQLQAALQLLWPCQPQPASRRRAAACPAALRHRLPPARRAGAGAAARQPPPTAPGAPPSSLHPTARAAPGWTVACNANANAAPHLRAQHARLELAVPGLALQGGTRRRRRSERRRRHAPAAGARERAGAPLARTHAGGWAGQAAANQRCCGAPWGTQTRAPGAGPPPPPPAGTRSTEGVDEEHARRGW